MSFQSPSVKRMALEARACTNHFIIKKEVSELSKPTISYNAQRGCLRLNAYFLEDEEEEEDSE